MGAYAPFLLYLKGDNMEDKVKNFLKKNGGYILIGGISIVICVVSYKYGFKKGQRQVEKNGG